MNDIRKNKLGIHVFVDSNNLNLAIKNCGWELDFVRFYIYLKDKYKANKALLFIRYVPGNKALYTFLQKIGYIVSYNFKSNEKKTERS